MRGFECDLEANVIVRFYEPEKTYDYIVSETFREVFFELDSLEEVTEYLSLWVMRNSTEFVDDRRGYFIEGFGGFIRTERDVYVLDGSKTGKISISVEYGIEASYVREF